MSFWPAQRRNATCGDPVGIFSGGTSHALTATSAEGFCTGRVVRAFGGPESVAEEFLNHHELNALFEEQDRGGAPQVVKPDAAKPGCPTQRGEMPRQGGRIGG